MSKVNIDELDAVLDYIEANPEKWNQTRWCGTACCVAGHVALRAGWKPAPWTTISNSGRMIGPNGQEDTASYVARETLGLAPEQGHALFDEHNTLPALRAMAAALRDDSDANLAPHMTQQEDE